MSVFFPADEIRDDRPTWADLGGLRKRHLISSNVCQNQYPCLIEARYADEGNDAIAADLLVLDPIREANASGERLRVNPPETQGVLYLRPGKYRLSSVSTENRILSRWQATIDAGDNAEADRKKKR